MTDASIVNIPGEDTKYFRLVDLILPRKLKDEAKFLKEQLVEFRDIPEH